MARRGSGAAGGCAGPDGCCSSAGTASDLPGDGAGPDEEEGKGGVEDCRQDRAAHDVRDASDGERGNQRQGQPAGPTSGHSGPGGGRGDAAKPASRTSLIVSARLSASKSRALVATGWDPAVITPATANATWSSDTDEAPMPKPTLSLARRGVARWPQAPDGRGCDREGGDAVDQAGLDEDLGAVVGVVGVNFGCRCGCRWGLGREHQAEDPGGDVGGACHRDPPAGATRGATTRTTKADPAAARPEDLVERQFKAQRPDELWVVDFTYVATWAGFVYVAFCIDVCSRLIPAGAARHR